MTVIDVVQKLAIAAADAYITTADQSQRWHAVARAIVTQIAASSDVPVDQLLATLAGIPIPLEAPQVAAPVTSGGAPIA
jgi:plasmid stability protein